MNRARVPFKDTITEDLFASVVVFLIALPFSMGVALASGAPIHAGLIPGAIAAIVACLLGGAPFVVSGPAASVAVIVFELAERYGVEAIGLATLGAGVVQVLMGGLRVAKIAGRIPTAVVGGMLASVGMLMAAGQSAVLFGASPKKDFWQNILHIPTLAAQGNWSAFGLGALTLAIILLWPRINLFKLPASLVGILTASLVAAACHADVPMISLPGQLWHISMPTMPHANVLELLGAAVAIGLIASTESLLSAVAVDKLHSGPRAKLNRELTGQGAANMVSGLLGGLPITGGSVRSTANIQAKARTRAATVMHGVWLLVAATFMAELLGHVPLATLAALLISVSIRLVDPKAMVMASRDRQFAAYAGTMVGVLALGLLWGISIGLVVSYGERWLQGARFGTNEDDAADNDPMPNSIVD